MALGALAANPDCGLKIVPCGMNYFHAHKFRSRAVVEFGTPVEVDPELVELYKKGERREAVSTLLETVYNALVSVTVTSPDYDTLMVRVFPFGMESLLIAALAYTSCTPALQSQGKETSIAHGRRIESTSRQRICALQRRSEDYQSQERSNVVQSSVTAAQSARSSSGIRKTPNSQGHLYSLLSTWEVDTPLSRCAPRPGPVLANFHRRKGHIHQEIKGGTCCVDCKDTST